MMNRVLLVGALGVASVFLGCSDDGRAGAIDPGDGNTSKGGKGSGGRNSASNAGESSAGEGGGGQTGDVFDVAITSPEAASDPVADDVIVGDDVTVVCLAREGDAGDDIDGSSVRIEVLDEDGEPVVGFDDKPLMARGVPTGEDDEYSATFALTAVASGPVSFRCSVSGFDSALTGSALLETFVDHGPTITERLPAKDSANPLEGVLAVEFTIDPAPLSDDDTEAAVTGVKLFVAGVEIVDVTEDQSNRGTYRAEVDFKDGHLFPEPPTEHTSVRIEAMNGRSPEGALAVRDYPFVVDGVGPTITFEDTRPRAVVGETIVEFTVSDTGAGLDEDTLFVEVSQHPDSPVKFDATDSTTWSHQANGSFRFRFDTGILEDVESQITVNVRAEDAAGNKGESGSLLLTLDNLPPWIDLDPPNARGLDSNDVCSASFDPLGPKALNDLEIVTARNNYLRALIYDQTTFGSGQTLSYMSGTKQTSARLYVQPNADEPFLVDTDGDGECDNLADDDEFRYIGLSPVKKAGRLTYSETDQAVSPFIQDDDPEAEGYCAVQAASATPPPTLCGELSDMTVVVDHDSKTQADEPIVYGIGNLPPSECTGTTWDLGLEVAKNGWICLAARASDNLGNVSVSRPLRICYDAADGDTPPCASDPSNPPSCTTDCTAPRRFPAAIYSF